MPSKRCRTLGDWNSLCIHWILQDMSGCGVMNNSQFWSWVDHWEGWDFMSDEQEHHMLLEDWDEELFCELDPCISERELRIIMICLECGNALDCCICEDAVPTPTPEEDHQHPSQ